MLIIFFIGVTPPYRQLARGLVASGCPPHCDLCVQHTCVPCTHLAPSCDICRATCAPLHCACVLAAREVSCCASHLRDPRLVTAPERGMTMDPRPNISSHRLHAHLQPCPRRIVGLVANGLALTGPVVASCCIGFPLFPCARVGISVARCARCVCCALSYLTRHT